MVELSTVPQDYLIASGEKTVEEVLTDLTSVLRKEHNDLKHWWCLRLEQQNKLLVEHGHSLGLLLEQQDHATGRLSTRSGSKPRRLTTPSSIFPEGNGTSIINLRRGSKPARSQSFAAGVGSTCVEDWAPVMPMAPDTPIPGFELGGTMTTASPRNSRRANLIGMPPSSANSDSCDSDLPPHPMQVPEEQTEDEDQGEDEDEEEKEDDERSSRRFSMSHRSSGRSEVDRAEWTRHLQRRVTEELKKKHFQRLSTKTPTLDRLSITGHLEEKKQRCPPRQLASGLLKLLESTLFQWASAGIIILNVVFIGYTTEASMSHVLASPPTPDPDSFELVNAVFTSIYCVELLLRLLAYGWDFATGPDRKWNAFDTILILLSISENIVQDVDAGVGTLRIIRGLRMFRVLRIIRVMRYFRDLRLMVCSILQSLGSLSWALLLLVIIMYLFSIVFMQGAILYMHSQHEDGRAPNSAVTDGVARWYSSVVDTMYTLLASITNGVGWSDVVQPLEHISMVYRWLYTFYIVFVVIGVLNVLTGIFVERACELSGMDKDLVIQTQMKRNETFLKEMKRIFEEADADGSGTISWEEFKGYLENDTVKAYLTTQQLDAFDARTLFDVLNDGTGNEMSIEKFIVGCQRLKGMARSVDLVAVLQEARSANRKLKSLMRRLEGGPGLARSSTREFGGSTTLELRGRKSSSAVSYRSVDSVL
mmetsp:Transcript_84080/g.246637  ORF Transcript_84080/g.246637 Transcript_84080/m.246637 type:complete len:705 (+) Transcript_84080:116-2230(+)